jgi:SAM-dependent methyltransferase
MKQATREWLNALNCEFYEAQAAAFSETRARPWRGFARVLEHVKGTTPRVLDIGCGNGRLVGSLRQQFGAGFDYAGVDASAALLAIARERYQGERAVFVRADFVREDPELVLPDGERELIALFGVLHHVPSLPARRALLRAAARRLAAGGMLAFTLWRFDRDPRFARRRVPITSETVLAVDPEISGTELDPGDHLVRWGQNGGGRRYCHFTDDRELATLIADLRLTQLERFRADGAGDSLNDYVLLRRR